MGADPYYGMRTCDARPYGITIFAQRITFHVCKANISSGTAAFHAEGISFLNPFVFILFREMPVGRGWRLDNPF